VEGGHTIDEIHGPSYIDTSDGGRVMCYTAQAKAVHVSPTFFSQGIRLEAGEPPSNRTIACALETNGQAVYPEVERTSI